MYSVGSDPSTAEFVFVDNVATSDELCGSTVTFDGIGVFHGPLAVYGGTHVEPPELTDTVHVTDAGLVEVTPPFTASTENVCDPFASPEYEAGEEHAEYPAPSNEHWNVDPASFELNANEADPDDCVDPPAGPDIIDTTGGTATDQLTAAGLDVKTRAATASTENSCEPFTRPEYDAGDEHAE